MSSASTSEVEASRAATVTATEAATAAATAAAAAAATAAAAAAVTAEASPTKSDEFGELDFVVVDEVDNFAATGSPPASKTDSSVTEVTIDANSNVTTPRVYHRREKKALALSLIDDIALQGGTVRKATGSVTDKLNPGRGEAATSPAPSSSPSPTIAIPTAAAATASNCNAAGHEDLEAVPGPRQEALSVGREEEQSALGFPSDKKRRQDDEVTTEDTTLSPHGDNEPILLPRIDASPGLGLPQRLQAATDGGSEACEADLSSSINNSSIIHRNDNTYTNNHKRANQTHHNKTTKQQVGEMEDKKHDDSQDDVVLLEVTPAKDADGFYSFHPFPYKSSRQTDDNFIDLCGKRHEEMQSPIKLLNAHVGDVAISQVKTNLAKSLDMASSEAAGTTFDVDKLYNAARPRDLTRHQRLLAAALDPASAAAFNLDRADFDDEKQEPRISETCQLLYRKIQSIVKSKSPEMCGSKLNPAESPHGNACRSLQDAINTAMVKAMSEDFEEDRLAQLKGKSAAHFGVPDGVASKSVPQRPASSGQTHLPPKKRALCIEDTTGTSNVSNRSPPLSKRRKTTSRIQKVRPILLSEGDDDKGSEEVTIVKPLDVQPTAEAAWPGTSVQCHPGPPGFSPEFLKHAGLPTAVDIAIERHCDKLHSGKSSMFAAPKRVMVKKKVGRRPSLSETGVPGMPPAVSSKGLFKLDSPPTVHGVSEPHAAEYFYGDNEESRFVQLKDNTVAFKDFRALQEPYTSSRYANNHVDLTGPRLAASSPAHFPPAVASQAAAAAAAAAMSPAFAKVGWPGHKPPQGMLDPHAYQQQQQPGLPPRSPVSQHGTYAGSPAGFFECLTSRANLATASRSWVPPKPKAAMPEASLTDSSSGVGHAFHPVTPSNKLMQPYSQYHHPSKNCAEPHRSVIKPQPGALHHTMVPVAAPLRPGAQLPFGQPQQPPAPLQAAYQPLGHRPGWAPTSTPPSPRTHYAHAAAAAAAAASSSAHYDPRHAAHFMRRSAEAPSYTAAAMASRFGATGAPVYHQLPRHPMAAPDASQANPFWPTGTQHPIPSVPPFTKQ